MEDIMSTYKGIAVVKCQEKIATDVYSMVLECEEAARQAKPGQFISLYCKDGSALLPRPISICEIEETTLRIVYRVVGKGTNEFCKLVEDDTIEIMGPLGNGFPLEDGKAIIIGGGIGIPPMLELAKTLNCEKNIVLGYRDEIFLAKEFEAYGNVSIASEDGKNGVKGNVLDAIKQNGIEGEVIYACGPTPMLRAIQAYAIEKGIKAYLSLEEKMACGIGACLACVCKSNEIDHHTNVNNKRICKDGPVFEAREIEF